MFKDLFYCVIFSILINWCISMQILNQSSKDKRIKIISSIISVITALTAGFLIFLVA